MEPKTEYDYIDRTLKILKQYETFNLPKDEQYDVTLLINACVCLLFIAKENKWLPSGAKETMGLNDEIILKCNMCQDDATELDAIFRHLRNSVAHFNLLTDGKPINILYFEDCKEDKKTNFEMKISVEKFKEFLLDISNYVLTHKKK